MVIFAVGPIGRFRITAKVCFRFACNETLTVYQTRDYADSVRAAAEAEREDLVRAVRAVIAAQKGVKVENVALESEPEGATDQRQRLE